jgi:ribose transport system substrate-binding protein
LTGVGLDTNLRQWETSAVAGCSGRGASFAVLVKSMNNPFFNLVRDGCKQAEAELEGIECLYIRPDRARRNRADPDAGGSGGQGVDAIAISPSNAPAMARKLSELQPQIPVITIDADLQPEDAALRTTYVGTDNYDLGVKLAEYTMKAKPDGGTVCLLSGGTAADNLNRRIQGSRDVLSGGTVAEGERLTGQNGWTEIDSCPLYTNDDAALGVQMMADILTSNPDLDAFILEGGWPQFAPQAYSQLTDLHLDKIRSGELVLAVSDTLEPQMQALSEGRSYVQVGQRPYEMGYRAMFVLKDLVEGKEVEDPIYTGLDECLIDTIDTCKAN